MFKKYRTKNQMYHVGIYMGDGTVVHAKGRDDGVVRENISKAGWNRFGRLKMLSQGGGSASYIRPLKRIQPHDARRRREDGAKSAEGTGV